MFSYQYNLDDIKFAFIYLDLAKNYELKEDLIKCFNFCEKSLEICNLNSEEENIFAEIFYKSAEMYFKVKKDFKKARSLAEKALNIYEYNNNLETDQETIESIKNFLKGF